VQGRNSNCLSGHTYGKCAALHFTPSGVARCTAENELESCNPRVMGGEGKWRRKEWVTVRLEACTSCTPLPVYRESFSKKGGASFPTVWRPAGAPKGRKERDRCHGNVAEKIATIR